MFINHLYAFFREISVYILWPLFLGVVCVSGIELHELLINKLINKDLILCQLFYLLLFPPTLRFAFSPCF